MSRTLGELLAAPPRQALLPDLVDDLAARLEAQHEAVPPEDWLERRDALRDGLRDVLGLDRVPLASSAPQTIGSIERDGYRIDRLVLQALPGLPMPAHLYLPEGPGPWPAVVHAPGHWMENAKLEPDLQRTNVRLARSGVAVLCYDTLGQGERRHGTWHQHGQLGTLLTGFTTLAVMVAESRHALDVLAGHPAIDAGRLGLIGASGGGWSGWHVAALDERVAAAAIVCIVNTHRGQIRAARGTGWDGSVCLCNQLPHLCALGSVGQLMALAAPRRLLVVHALEDPPFPVDGARVVAGELDRLYEAAGAAGGFTYVEVPGGHGLTPPARTAACDWLAQALGQRSAAPELPHGGLLEPPFPVIYVADAIADGVRQSLRRGPRLPGECLREDADSNGPLLALVRARARELRAARGPLQRGRLATWLGPDPAVEPARAVLQNRVRLAEGFAERLTIDVEPGVTLDAVLELGGSYADAAPPVVVVLDEGGKAEALASPEAAAVREAGAAVLGLDVRGTGESACAEWETATAAFMLDRDLLAQRVFDVRRAVEAIARRAVVGQQLDRGRIAVVGRGPLGLVALVAAALDQRIAGAVSSGFVQSLDELLVEVPETTPMAYPYRLLELADLGDLAALAAPRAVLVEGDVADLLGRLS